MYHQCLTCGAVYPKGSVDVLDGCSKCGKARFSFTNQPMPEAELLELKRAANDDLGILMKEIFKRNMRVSKLSRDEKKIVGKETDGWFKVKMEDKVEREEVEREKVKREKVEVETKRPGPSISLEDAPMGEGISGHNIIDRLLRSSHERRTPEGKEKDVRKKTGKPVWDKLVRMAPGDIEVIRETEDGVYEIDLDRMFENVLNKTPVVMMESGVYLINLGSDLSRTQAEKR